MKEYRAHILQALAHVVAAFARNDWSLSRGHFYQVCKRAGIESPTAQAILEVDFGLDVKRVGHKKMADDRMDLDCRAGDLIDVAQALAGKDAA